MTHSHHHDHHHETPDNPGKPSPRGAQEPGFDPAAQSLADALQFSFTALKFVMVILIAYYLVSGCFTVETQHTAVKLRFGKIIAKHLKSGSLHFALPRPFDQIIEVDTTSRELDVKKAFWFEFNPQTDGGKTTDELAQSKMGPLNPEKDGSLITGDANIVHAQWSITYRVDDPAKYIVNVSDDVALAENLVRLAAEQSIVHNVAELTSDDLLKGVSNATAIKDQMQGILYDLKTGLKIDQVSITKMSVPLSTRPAFQAVLNAENEKAREIESAQEQRVNILSTAAGEAHDELLTLVEQYENAIDAHTTGDVLDQINAKLHKVLDNLSIDGMPVSGEVAGIINEAQVYRTSIVEKVQSEAQKLEQLYDQYKKSPRIIQQRIIQDARREILASPMNETFYVTEDGQQYLELNRDPGVKRQRERARLEKERMDRVMNNKR